MRELFIYYRLRSGNASAALAATQAFQGQLTQRHPALVCRVLRRPEEAGGWQTWMETYATDPAREPAGVTSDIQADIETQAGALAPMIDGGRHIEVFVPCAP